MAKIQIKSEKLTPFGGILDQQVYWGFHCNMHKVTPKTMHWLFENRKL